MTIECEVCGGIVEEVGALIRVNEYGVDGVWRCLKHPPECEVCGRSAARVKITRTKRGTYRCLHHPAS